MSRGFLFLILVLLMPVSLAVQELLPAIPPFRERLQLLPVVFVFGAAALPLVPALWFSLLAAAIQGLALLQVQGGEAEMGLTLPVVFFVSWALVLQTVGEATRGMRWELHAFGSALVTASMIAGEFLWICIKRGGFPLDGTVLSRILVPSAAAFLLAPVLYVALRSLVPVVAPEDEDGSPF